MTKFDTKLCFIDGIGVRPEATATTLLRRWCDDPKGGIGRNVLGLRRQLRRFWRSQRAVAAVEFALVAPVLVLLLCGTIASSAAFLTWGMMQGSTSYGARIMATGTVKNNHNGAISTTNTTATITCSSSLTSTSVEYYACSNLPSWATFSVTTTENCAVPSVTVSLSTTASSAAIADVMRLFSGKTLTSTSVVMKEGTCP